MTLFQRLDQIEERLWQSFRKNSFDTFNQLLSERLVLLKEAHQSPDNEAILKMASKQTARWNEVLGKRVGRMRRSRMKMQAVGGYGSHAPKPGRMLNHSM